MHPNILIVCCDQLRQAAVGCYGQDPVLTPNLDAFASQSLVLTHCVSNQPVCTPYRGMLFTGQYPFSNGLTANCNSSRDVELRDDARCLSDVLAGQGYSCGYIGKLHLHKPRPPYEHTEGPRGDGVVWDAYTPPGPARHGFSFWHSYGCCDRHMHPHYWRGDSPIEDRVIVDGWSVRHETDVAIDYLRNSDGRHRPPGQPFFLMVSHNPPHPPLNQVPPRYLEPFSGRAVTDLLCRPNARYDKPQAAQQQAALYFAAVAGIDEQFGRLMGELNSLGLAQDTIVIFTSDHGEMLYSHGLRNKNVWYDESLLVPFLLRWPGRVKARRDDLLLGVPDVMPTLLAMAGLAQATPPRVEGSDLSAAVQTGGGSRPTSAFYLWPNWQHAGRREFISARGIRTHGHMLVVGREVGGDEVAILHDCQSDPYQLHNVADTQPAAVAELRRELDCWLERTNDPWLRGGIEDRR